MANTISIVDALRCQAGPVADHLNCDNCPWQLLEEINEKIPIPADVIIDGVGYWKSCDGDSLLLEAANRIVLLETKVREAKNKVLQLKLDRGIYGDD